MKADSETRSGGVGVVVTLVGPRATAAELHIAAAFRARRSAAKACAGAVITVALLGCQGADQDPGEIATTPRPTLPCEPDPAGCVVQFEDPEFAALGRDTVYYVRALQTPTPAINGANLRTRFEDGRAVSLRPCRVGAGADAADDCLADVQERAWSSPIFVDYRR